LRKFSEDGELSIDRLLAMGEPLAEPPRADVHRDWKTPPTNLLRLAILIAAGFLALWKKRVPSGTQRGRGIAETMAPLAHLLAQRVNSTWISKMTSAVLKNTSLPHAAWCTGRRAS
jgi:hypothetical protein